MVKSEIGKLEMKFLIEQIKKGFCVPFLGAGVNIGNHGYKGLLTGRQLATKMAEELGYDNGTTPKITPNLARLALEFEVRTQRRYLIDFISNVLPDQQCEPSPALMKLASLPFKLIITANYDRLLERALEKAGTKFKVVVQPTKGLEFTPDIKKFYDDLIDYDGCIVYKIHGTFVNKDKLCPGQTLKNLDPIIITEDDYIDFLTFIGKDPNKIGIPNFIASRITTGTLLFLGYSLEDWDFRVLYKGLIEDLNIYDFGGIKSFAIQKDPEGAWVDFWIKKNIDIYNMDIYDFADQLEQGYHGKSTKDENLKQG